MNSKLINLTIIGLMLFQISCKKFIEIEPPRSSLVHKTIFKFDEVATSAVTGIYRTMSLTTTSFAAGGPSSISSVSGASADELIGYNSQLREFYNNQISTTNTYISNSLYSTPYKCIYSANAVIEGLTSPNEITPSVKSQLLGEAYFIRAFNYFYLVNLYGPVPLQLTTDYRITQHATRATNEKVYQQIIEDLVNAEELLPEAYVSIERIRPNKSAAQALLARTYLYLQDWANAEKYASLVIGKSNTYKLVDLDEVFLKNSTEAIWQLMPTANGNTGEGNLFILTNTPTLVSLRQDFVDNAFDPNDKRKTSWVKTFSNSSGTYFYPFKYKIKSSTTITEYSMVLRLAEQFLIRAEANINLGKISKGVTDLNLVRQRPIDGVQSNPIMSLPLTLSKANALLAVNNERRVELFSEWGHRWLDLKRINSANSVLSITKPQWQSTDTLYPIPSIEIARNSLITQNLGY